MNYNISKETLEDLYLKKKMSCMEISKIYGCHRNTIGAMIKRYDIETRGTVECHEAKEIHKRGYDITIEQVLALVDSGKLMQEIAEHFHVKKQVIYRITSNHGLNFLNGPVQRERHSIFVKLMNRHPEYHKYTVNK